MAWDIPTSTDCGSMVTSSCSSRKSRVFVAGLQHWSHWQLSRNQTYGKRSTVPDPHVTSSIRSCELSEASLVRELLSAACASRACELSDRENTAAFWWLCGLAREDTLVDDSAPCRQAILGLRVGFPDVKIRLISLLRWRSICLVLVNMAPRTLICCWYSEVATSLVWRPATRSDVLNSSRVGDNVECPATGAWC